MATLVAMPSRRRALGELSSTRSNKLAMTKHLQTGMFLHARYLSLAVPFYLPPDC